MEYQEKFNEAIENIIKYKNERRQLFNFNSEKYNDQT